MRSPLLRCSVMGKNEFLLRGSAIPYRKTVPGLNTLPKGHLTPSSLRESAFNVRTKEWSRFP